MEPPTPSWMSCWSVEAVVVVEMLVAAVVVGTYCFAGALASRHRPTPSSSARAGLVEARITLARMA